MSHTDGNAIRSAIRAAYRVDRGASLSPQDFRAVYAERYEAVRGRLPHEAAHEIGLYAVYLTGRGADLGVRRRTDGENSLVHQEAQPGEARPTGLGTPTPLSDADAHRLRAAMFALPVLFPKEAEAQKIRALLHEFGLVRGSLSAPTESHNAEDWGHADCSVCDAARRAALRGEQP